MKTTMKTLVLLAVITIGSAFTNNAIERKEIRRQHYLDRKENFKFARRDA